MERQKPALIEQTCMPILLQQPWTEEEISCIFPCFFYIIVKACHISLREKREMDLESMSYAFAHA